MAERLETNIVRFRSALGGFNKKDVTDYLVQISNSHRESLLRLNEQVTRLENENAELRQIPSEADRIKELEDYNCRLMERVRGLEDELAALRNREPEQVIPAPVAEAPQVQPEVRELELEAYRRAEAMERRATQRFRQVSQQVEAVSADMVAQLGAALESAKSALAAIEAQLATLQDTSDQLDAAMTGGAAKLEAMASAFVDEE